MRGIVGPIAVPDEVYFVTQLPKTRSGKIIRRILKAVATDTNIGDLTTLEDEASVEEVIKSYHELKKAKEKLR
jgi:acetyl-CoA synthetase